MFKFRMMNRYKMSVCDNTWHGQHTVRNMQVDTTIVTLNSQNEEEEKIKRNITKKKNIFSFR